MPKYEVTFKLDEIYCIEARNGDTAYCEAWEKMMESGYFESSMRELTESEGNGPVD